jgi:hypothetical protein
MGMRGPGTQALDQPAARRADCACMPCAICPSRQLAARCRCCALPQITSIIRAVPHSAKEGRFAIVTNVERGMRWTRQRRRVRSGRRAIHIVSGSRREDERRYADGEVVWSWHPLLMLSLS